MKVMCALVNVLVVTMLPGPQRWTLTSKQSLRQGSSFRFTEELSLKTKESKICRKVML